MKKMKFLFGKKMNRIEAEIVATEEEIKLSLQKFEESPQEEKTKKYREIGNVEQRYLDLEAILLIAKCKTLKTTLSTENFSSLVAEKEKAVFAATCFRLLRNFQSKLRDEVHSTEEKQWPKLMNYYLDYKKTRRDGNVLELQSHRRLSFLRMKK